MAHTDNNAAIPATMSAMLLTGHGDVDVLQYRQDVPTPQPGPGQVLVQVTATAKNNTDRKAREGLYPTKGKEDVTSFAMGGSPTLTFPRIQGADVAGRIVAVGEGVDAQRIGERGLLDFNLYADERRDINLTPDYYGHGADGGNPHCHDQELSHRLAYLAGVTCPLAERPGELEGDPGSAEPGKGVTAAGQAGVYQHVCRRQRLARREPKSWPSPPALG